MMPKKVLIVTQGIPHPTKGASAVLFFSYIAAIKAAGHTVFHLILDSPRAEAKRELDEYASAIGSGAAMRILHTVLPRVYSFSYRTFALEAVMPSSAAISAVQEFGPEATVCFDIVAAGVARKMGLQNLKIWLGDLSYQTCVYHAFYDATIEPAKALNLPRALASHFVWKRFYKTVLKNEPHVIVSSKSSEDRLNALGVQSAYLPYPWPGANPRRVAQVKHEKPTFIMFGTLAALGSKSAFLFLLKKVYPLLLNRWGTDGFQILIAGARDLPDWVKGEMPNHPNLKFLGFVDDLAAVVDRCHATLAPIAVPVGNRSRILTAMSMGSAVIAHSNTKLGNPELVSGTNCFLANTPEGFAQHMFRVFDAPDEAVRIGEAARLKYLECFEPNVACEQFLKMTSLDLIQ